MFDCACSRNRFSIITVNLNIMPRKKTNLVDFYTDGGTTQMVKDKTKKMMTKVESPKPCNGTFYIPELRATLFIPDGFSPTVGGDLDLRNLTSIPDGFSPTVGGDLYLRSVTALPEGFNPTVGGYLDLRNLTSIPDSFKNREKKTVNQSDLKKSIKSKIKFEWVEGRFVKIDGIVTEIMSTRGRVSQVKIVGKRDITYLVTDGKDNFAHGNSIKQAKEDLKFKVLSEKLKNEPIKADTKVTVNHYRLLTGACKQGCANWLTQNGIAFEMIGDTPKELKPILAKDLLKILEKSNAYGLDRFRKLIAF